MTKEKQLELLEKIDGLIKSADADSYICDTFAGIVDVCRENIRNDFGIHPVEDSRIYLDQRDAEIRMHDETKRMLANAQSIARKAIDERDKYAVDVAESGKQILRLEHENNAMAETLKAKDAEIEKLGHMLDGKVAEVERLRDERDVMVECHDGLSEICDKYEQEIMRLKAEVYDLRNWGESPVVPERSGW